MLSAGSSSMDPPPSTSSTVVDPESAAIDAISKTMDRLMRRMEEVLSRMGTSPEGVASATWSSASSAAPSSSAPPPPPAAPNSSSASCTNLPSPTTTIASSEAGHAPRDLTLCSKPTCYKSLTTPSTSSQYHGVPSSSSMVVFCKLPNSVSGAQKMFDETPLQIEVFVGGARDTVEDDFITVMPTAASSTSSNSISKRFAQISPPLMMPDSVVFLAHEVFAEMSDKKKHEQVLCIWSPGQFFKCYELQMFASTWKFPWPFPWCCALGVHLKPMGKRNNQNHWPPPMCYYRATSGLDLLPLPLKPILSNAVQVLLKVSKPPKPPWLPTLPIMGIPFSYLKYAKTEVQHFHHQAVIRVKNSRDDTSLFPSGKQGFCYWISLLRVPRCKETILVLSRTLFSWTTCSMYETTSNWKAETCSRDFWCFTLLLRVISTTRGRGAGLKVFAAL